MIGFWCFFFFGFGVCGWNQHFLRGERLCEVARSDIYVYIIYDVSNDCVKSSKSISHIIYTLVKTNGWNLTLKWTKTTSCSHFVPFREAFELLAGTSTIEGCRCIFYTSSAMLEIPNWFFAWIYLNRGSFIGWFLWLHLVCWRLMLDTTRRVFHAGQWFWSLARNAWRSLKFFVVSSQHGE